MHQVERAGVDAADIRDGVARRIFHQHSSAATEQVFELLEQLGATAVRLHLEAESRDVPGVDVVNQQLWLAVPRNVQKGAPRRFQVRVASEKSAEGWVRAAEVIHKPA